MAVCSDPRTAESISPVALLLAVVLLLLSFAPPQLKLALHTRGALHPWAHLYLFALIGGFSGSSRRHRDPGAWRVPGAVVLLACVIEATQCRGCLTGMEWSDLLIDSAGTCAGLLVPIRMRPRGG